MKIRSKHHETAAGILDFIKKNDHFLVSAHLNADGDAVASVIAVGLLLEHLDKTCYMVLHDQTVDRRFNYLKNFDLIHAYSEDLNLDIKTAIILDVPGLKRLGDVVNLLPGREKIIKIDHHPIEDDFAALNLVDELASSTTQLIYELFEVANIDVTSDMAQAIYTGIVYDTGRFSFSNTTARDMYICGRMIELGVSPAKITNRMFFENSFGALRTIGEGLANLESHLDGAVNLIYLNYRAMSNNHQSEIEELANYSVAIRGGEVGLFMREFNPDKHKISFRSKGKVDVNIVAKAFNGGGHARAAGCRVEGKKADILPGVLAEIKKQL